MDIINGIYLGITILALAVIAIAVLLLFKPINEFLQNKMQKDSYETLMDIAAAGVGWAEQWLVGSSGVEKKHEVVNYVRNKAEEYGLTITEADIDKVIENAVLEMKKREKEEEATNPEK